MKKLLSLIIAAALLIPSVVSCGSNDGGSGKKESSKTSKNENVITVAASSAPHAQILEQCKPLMEQKGYKLEINVMDDYITPNTATDSGDVDANYFQHQPYLDQFNAENGTKLVTVARVHYEPYGIYAGTVKSLNDLKEGSVVAVPNDATNEARALLLLEAKGLIKLKEGVGLKATKNDIISNPKKLDIREMEAALLPGVLDEVAIAIINGNYALGAGLNVKTALASEDSKSEAAQTFANILVVKEGNENLDKVKALVEVLTSDTIAEYINNQYDGAVVSIK